MYDYIFVAFFQPYFQFLRFNVYLAHIYKLFLKLCRVKTVKGEGFMRPVKVPDNPPDDSYSEDQQLEEYVYKRGGKKKRKRWEDVIKKEVVSEVADYINKWIDEGGKLHGNQPVFKQTEDLNLYKDYRDMLGKGGHNWGDARKALIQSIGQYCSYCGSPIYSHLHIEHVLPKSFFPQHAFAWNNFLLSCPTCNSAKGDDPNQATISNHVLSTDEAKDKVFNKPDIDYLWPFFDWDRIDTFFPFRYELKWMDAYRNRLRFKSPVNDDEMVTLFQSFKKGELKVERGIYYYQEPGKRMKHKFGLELQPNPVCSDKIRQAAQRVIDMASLNTIVSAANSSKSVDRRLEMRTQTYFVAKQVRSQLFNALVSDQSDSVYPIVSSLAKRTIAATGFWGIWFQIIGWKSEENQKLLRECFPGTSPKNWDI